MPSTHLWKLISFSPTPSLLPSPFSNNYQKLSISFYLPEIKGTKDESQRTSQGVEETDLPGSSSAALLEAAQAKVHSVSTPKLNSRSQSKETVSSTLS